ncbi:hypothetical protein BDR07DRAFT_1498782 [Suillus spraguei]|nr:hypothetical protein BDR07DRAFT_1498782 [Suillus spraguei]
MHLHEQEVKNKEILRLQAAAALQDKEAETWHLKIQYETMMWSTLPYVQLLSKDCQTVDPSSSNEKLALEYPHMIYHLQLHLHQALQSLELQIPWPPFQPTSENRRILDSACDGELQI